MLPGRGSAAIVIERHQDFTVDPDGKLVRKESGAIRILSRRAAASYVEVAGHESTDRMVIDIKTRVIRSSRRIIESKKRDIQSQVRLKFITAPGVEDGSLLGYRITTEARALGLQRQRLALKF